MKRTLYYQIHNLFIKLNLFAPLKYLLYYLETLVYFAYFSKWLRVHKPSVLDNKKVEKNITKRRFILHEKIFTNEELDKEIDYLEFGVASGTSIKWWSSANKCENSKFYGFDTFVGLPEAWFHNKQGDFNQDGNFPQIQDDRVNFIKGLYQNTLFEFLKSTTLNRKKVIHLDADLYSSTLFVLSTLHPHLKKDDVIIFDDFGYLMGEFRALEHYSSSFYQKYKVIGAVNNYGQVAIKII